MTSQYGLRWTNAPTSLVHQGRSVAHGLARIWRKAGADPVVVVRNGWRGTWRDDNAPAGDQQDGGQSHG